MAKPSKRRVPGSRVTPKKGATAGSLSARPTTARPKTAKRAEPRGERNEASESAGRYTAPVPRSVKVSPWWVPALMFTLLGIGMLVIFLNYIGVFGDPNNIRLVIGLGLILGGILVATRYH
jgi:cell division protein CrgA